MTVKQKPTENITFEKEYVFSNYTAGTQYAENEEHKLDDYVTIITTQFHFTKELRIYSSSTHNGYAIGILTNTTSLKTLSFNAGENADTIIVYGSVDGTTWTKVEKVATTSSYKDHTISFGDADYTYFKLDVEGSKQVRIKSITVTTK